MRKLFLLIPVLAFALMANAKEIEVSSGTSNIIHFTIAASSTSDGDVLVLKDAGPYVSTKADGDDYTKLSKNITIKAKAGITPVVRLQVPIQGRDGKSAKFIGIKFDCGDLQYSNFIHFNDALDNELEFEDCEFYNSNQYLVRISEGKKVESLKFKNCKFYNNSSTRGILNEGTIGHLELDGCEVSGFVKEFIHGYSGSSHVDECIINDCYFHNNSRSAVMFVASTVEGQQTCDQLTVTNSTFANINATGEYESVIEVRPYGSATTDAINVLVDHCTFYNNTTIDGSYTNIRTAKLSDVTISNCIFAHSEEYARRATYCTGGGNINNCLTYNYTAEGTKGHAYGATVNAASVVADPQFTDAANGDFTFANNWVTMSLSPAIGAGTDGSDLGDPRWHTAGTLPTTDFASAYDLLGTKALLFGNIELNESDHIKYKGSQVAGSAKWKLHISRACAIGAVADREAESTSGCTLTLTAYDADGNEVSAITAARSDNDNDINFPGCLYIPEEGDYTIILTNSVEYSGAILEKITLSYMGGAVQAMPGTTDIDEAWFIGGTRADGKITFTSGHVNDGWAKWNVSFASAANYNVYLNVNSGNGKKFTVALQDANGNDVVPSLYLNGGAQGTPVALEMGAMEVPAGSYILKVTNAEAWSDAEILSVTFAYAGGAAIDLSKTTPASLLANADAILSSDWSIEDNKIVHPESKALTGWAKWNVDCANDGNYNVTVNIASDNGHLVRVEVFEDENAPAIYTLNETSATQYHTGDQAINLGNIALEDKEYVFKVSNTGEYSHVQIASIVITYVGGAVVNIPTAEIPLVDAIRSTRAFIDAEGLHFTDAEHLSTISDEWAKWNIAVASEGLYKFTAHCSSTNYSNLTIAVYDGETELYTYTPQYTYKQDDKEISSPEWLLEAGNYVLKLSNPANNSNGYLLSLSASVADNIIILDEMAMDNSVIHANNGEIAKKIMIKRTFVAGMYNTICLPFSDWNSSLELIFGTGYELLELESAELEGDVLNLMFNSVTELGHGRPYLIKPTQDVVNPIFGTGHTIDERTDGYNVKSCTNADFIGSFIKGEVPAGEDNLFLGPNNTLYFSQDATPIKGMRAWFKIKGGAAGVAKRACIVLPNNVPTEIELVNSQEPAKSQKLLQDGQLIIIRDGVQYNVMGVKMK